MKKISIIMGVHNGAHRFDEAIKSIMEQTYTNWEFVICDDGSSDNSYELLKKYEECDKRFRVIKNEGNKGLPYTLNHCLAYCTGEYIARMDDDDYCYPDRFEKQVKFLEDHADISFVSSCVDLWDGKKVIGRLMHSAYPSIRNLVYQTQFVHPATMFRANEVKKVGGYRVCRDTMRGQDYDLFMRMYGAGYKGANLQHPVYRYLMDNNNIKRRTLKARVGEFKIRIHGYKAMGVMWWAWPFLMKPFIAHIITKLRY